MSRGPGRLQRALFTMIRQHGKSMTFNDIRAVVRKQLTKTALDTHRLSGHCYTHRSSGHCGVHCSGWSQTAH